MREPETKYTEPCWVNNQISVKRVVNYSTYFRSFIVVTEQSLETCLWRLLKVTSVLVFDQTDATLPVENQRVICEIPLTESVCLGVWAEYALNQQVSL